MSEVKVKCPKCSHTSVLDSADLNKTQGRAVCSSCNHIFQLVKKSKKAQQPNAKPDAKPTEKAAPQTQANTAKPTAPKKETEKKAALQGEVLAKEKPKEKSAADKLREQTAKSLDAFFSAHNKNAHDKKESATPKIAKTVHEISKQQHPQHPEQRPLEYRVPRANGATHTFAEVGNGTAFSLLDRDSINSQLPQIAMKPAAKNSKTTAVSEMRTDGQQNNITIHTDSLVFTLLGDGQGGTSMSPVAAPNTLALGNHAPTIPPTKNDVALSPSGEFNWMAASIAALMVLIMQLFYWVLDIH